MFAVALLTACLSFAVCSFSFFGGRISGGFSGFGGFCFLVGVFSCFSAQASFAFLCRAESPTTKN